MNRGLAGGPDSVAGFAARALRVDLATPTAVVTATVELPKGNSGHGTAMTGSSSGFL